MPTPIIGRPVSDQVWADLRAEFTLPALEQVRRRLTELTEDPEPVMQQLVRVFIGEGTFCPGFQFQPDMSVNSVIAALFQRAMQLRIPHNYFAVWMMTPCHVLDGIRPVDQRQEQDQAALLLALESTLARAVAQKYGSESNRHRRGRRRRAQLL
ncbi:hypothetical protein ACLKOZ_03705 [Arthrobacter sp. R4]|uniref:hypothetical protein n=1 Tax=Arthrobacter sp. R4 TaxID=644417 RepID=UPI003EDA39D3